MNISKRFVNQNENEVILDSIFINSPNPMWISDSEGTLIKLNKSCRELLCIGENEVSGKYNIFKDNIVAEQGLMHFVDEVFEKGNAVRFTMEYDSSQLRGITLANN